MPRCGLRALVSGVAAVGAVSVLLLRHDNLAHHHAHTRNPNPNHNHNHNHNLPPGGARWQPPRATSDARTGGTGPKFGFAEAAAPGPLPRLDAAAPATGSYHVGLPLGDGGDNTVGTDGDGNGGGGGGGGGGATGAVAVPAGGRGAIANIGGCVFSSWSPWSECGPPCTGNDRMSTRRRNLLAPANTNADNNNANNNGPAGDIGDIGTGGCGDRLVEHRPCDCMPTSVCQVGPWSGWSPCRADCGWAVQHRTRLLDPDPTCTPDPADPDPATDEAQSCGNPSCDPARGAVFGHHPAGTPGPGNGTERAINIAPKGSVITSVGSDGLGAVTDAVADAARNSNRGASATARGTDPDHAGGLVGCGDFDKLKFIDDGPFARGYSKEVWRAKLGSDSVVVKRPIAKDHISRFRKGIKWEEKWLTELKDPRYLMRFYGHCRDTDNAFEVVEGGLTKWDFLMRSNASWCFRMRMALESTDILAYLSRKRTVHCDWKYDQAALDRQGHVKLVDVKSVRWLPVDGSPYKAETGCKSDAICKKCMKVMNLSYDHSCIHGRCAGYGTPSMVAVTAQSFFRPLLQTNAKDAPGPGTGGGAAQYHADVETLLTHCEARVPADRWTIPEVKAWLQAMMARYGGAECLVAQEAAIVGWMAAGYDEMVSTRDARCGPGHRYC